MSRPPKSRGDWGAAVEMEVAEEFPKDAGPYLKRPYEEIDARKLDRFIAKMGNCLDECSRKRAVALMVNKEVLDQENCRAAGQTGHGGGGEREGYFGHRYWLFGSGLPYFFLDD